jgi:polyisoprenoid-binding protein YceI
MTIQRLKVAGGLAAALAGLFATQLLAAKPVDQVASNVPAGSYKLESSHARVLFSVSHVGLSTWYGEFPGAEGSLDLNPADLAHSKLSVSVQTAGITTTSTVLDGELRSPTWFDAARYPTITFQSRRITKTAPGKADILGDLTLHGVTKPVVLHASFNGAGINPFAKKYTVGFEVSGKIKRSDFGVREDLPLIGDDVTLIITAPFEKQG